MATEQVLWRHVAGPPWPNFEAVNEYLQAHGISPERVNAIEYYQPVDRRMPMLRVECFPVDEPPGFTKETS